MTPPYGPSYKQREPKKSSGYLAARPSTAQIRLYPAPLIFWEYYIHDLATEPFSIVFTVLKKKKKTWPSFYCSKKISAAILLKPLWERRSCSIQSFFFRRWGPAPVERLPSSRWINVEVKEMVYGFLIHSLSPGPCRVLFSSTFVHEALVRQLLFETNTEYRLICLGQTLSNHNSM